MRLLVLLLLLTALGPAAVTAQDVPYGSSISFAALRNGEPIGKHVVTFDRDGAQLRVSTTIDLTVKFLGITAYAYKHRAQEVWYGDHLFSLASQTDDNGKKYAVNAERRDEGLVVSVNATGRRIVPSRILPSSHWNFRQINQSALLNTQNGTEVPVQIALVGRENVNTSAGLIEASRYRYSGGVVMDQWFDDRGRWVKMAFAGSDGSLIEYVLQE